MLSSFHSSSRVTAFHSICVKFLLSHKQNLLIYPRTSRVTAGSRQSFIQSSPSPQPEHSCKRKSFGITKEWRQNLRDVNLLELMWVSVSPCLGRTACHEHSQVKLMPLSSFVQFTSPSPSHHVSQRFNSVADGSSSHGTWRGHETISTGVSLSETISVVTIRVGVTFIHTVIVLDVSVVGKVSLIHALS